jgi:hypothetical protein
MAELGLAPYFQNYRQIFFKALAQLLQGSAEGQRFPLYEPVADTKLKPSPLPFPNAAAWRAWEGQSRY